MIQSTKLLANGYHKGERSARTVLFSGSPRSVPSWPFITSPLHHQSTLLSIQLVKVPSYDTMDDSLKMRSVFET